MAVNLRSFVAYKGFLSLKMLPLRLIFLFLIIPFCVAAQEEEEADTLHLPDFTGVRVYKTLEGALQNPDSVYRLDLRYKKLKELPPEIQKLTQLRELNISKNKLRDLPPWIGSLKNLEVLDVSSNKLSAVPAEIGQLEKLVVLRLNRNLIETLPPETGNLMNLQVLEMWDNELISVPFEMKKLVNLKVFELRGILFNEQEQQQIRELLPETTIYFSPSCNCPK
jgi:Leucine-rich repeat (LRR) protein